jgi:hypothetical protein
VFAKILDSLFKEMFCGEIVTYFLNFKSKIFEAAEVKITNLNMVFLRLSGRDFKRKLKK